MRTRADLLRSNQMQHRDLIRLARENQRLRRALDLVSEEVDATSKRFFIIVTKAALREMAERVRAIRWAYLAVDS